MFFHEIKYISFGKNNNSFIVSISKTLSLQEGNLEEIFTILTELNYYYKTW